MRATRDDLRPSSDEAEVAAPRISRRARALALLVALIVVGALGIGSLADAVGAVPFSPQPTSAKTQTPGFSVSLTLLMTPGQPPQTQSALLHISDASGQPVVGAHVQCALSMPTMAMALPAEDATIGPGVGDYVCPAQALDPGVWQVTLKVTLLNGETDQATLRFVVA